MLWEFIYTHRHTHFYLILISLPSCLLNKHTVNHIIPKEFCKGTAPREDGTATFITQILQPCHIFQQAQRQGKPEGFSASRCNLISPTVMLV